MVAAFRRSRIARFAIASAAGEICNFDEITGRPCVHPYLFRGNGAAGARQPAMRVPDHRNYGESKKGAEVAAIDGSGQSRSTPGQIDTHYIRYTHTHTYVK